MRQYAPRRAACDANANAVVHRAMRCDAMRRRGRLVKPSSSVAHSLDNFSAQPNPFPCKLLSLTADRLFTRAYGIKNMYVLRTRPKRAMYVPCSCKLPPRLPPPRRTQTEQRSEIKTPNRNRPYATPDRRKCPASSAIFLAVHKDNSPMFHSLR